MDKVDVLKIVRDNKDKFKSHMQKMRELEEKEKDLDYYQMYRNEKGDDRLTTIPEGENESHSIKKSGNQLGEIRNNYKPREKIYPGESESNHLYEGIYDSNGSNDQEVGRFSDDENFKSQDDEDNQISGSENEAEEDESLQGHLRSDGEEEYEYSEDGAEEPYTEREDRMYKLNKSDNGSDDKHKQGDESQDDQNSDQEDASYTDDQEERKHFSNPYEDSEEEECYARSNNYQNDSLKEKMLKPRKLTPKFNSTNIKEEPQNYHPTLTEKSKQHTRSSNKSKPGSMFNCPRPYSAFTYSTIKKMKQKPSESQPKSKLKLNLEESVFQERILTQKKYNGKSDRVALYQYHKSFWEKKPFLSGKPKEKLEITEKVSQI